MLKVFDLSHPYQICYKIQGEARIFCLASALSLKNMLPKRLSLRLIFQFFFPSTNSDILKALLWRPDFLCVSTACDLNRLDATPEHLFRLFCYLHQHMLLNYSSWESLVFADRHHWQFSLLRLLGFPSFVIYRNIDQFHASLKWVFFCSCMVLDN